MAGYPIVVELAGRKCVVIGGGAVAERKVHGLLAVGAVVTVVTPRPSEDLQARAARGDLELVRRRYRSGDLAGATLAFTATGDKRLAATVSREGRRRGIWVNAADDPEHCDFFLPAVLRRGPLLIAVATGGKSPALARAVREELERLLPEDYAALAETVADVRRELKARGLRPDASTWNRALSAEMRRLTEDDSRPEARARLLASLSGSATGSPGDERRGVRGARG